MPIGNVRNIPSAHADVIYILFIRRKPRQESGGMALVPKRRRTKEEKEEGGRPRLSFFILSRPVRSVREDIIGDICIFSV